jgi:hypothetical protein
VLASSVEEISIMKRKKKRSMKRQDQTSMPPNTTHGSPRNPEVVNGNHTQTSASDAPTGANKNLISADESSVRRAGMEADRWALKFKDRKSFGEFCLTLRSEGVPFGLSGFYTITFAIPLQQLGEKSRCLYSRYENEDLIEAFPVNSGGKRRLPNADETKAMLRKFTEELRSRSYNK